MASVSPTKKLMKTPTKPAAADAEVVEATAVRDRLALGIQDAQPGTRLDSADPRQREPELDGERVELGAPRGRRGESEIVVVAA